jgi:hypothetical protein
MNYKKSVVMKWLGGILAMGLSLTNCAKDDPFGVQSNSSVSTKQAVPVQTLSKDGKNRKRPELVAYYPFRGNAKDKSGNKNHGTVFGATLTKDRFGHRKSAYDFDGVDDYIQADNTKNLRLSSWTLAGWIKLRDSFSQAGMIVWKVQDSNQKYNFATVVQDFDGPEAPKVSSQYETCDDEFDHFVFSDHIQKEVWTFFASTRDEESGEVRTYVDGQLQGSADSSPEGLWKEHIPCMNSDQLQIGAINTTQLFSPFNGAIDDIRIYNGVLNDEEIEELYTRTKNKDDD